MPFDLGYQSHHYKSSRPGYRGTSLQELFTRFPNDHSCLRHIAKARFGKRPKCRCCGKASRYSRVEGNRYLVNRCGDKISPLKSTVFHTTKLPLSIWFYAMLHVANSAHGANALFFERHLGVNYLTAVRLLRRIRIHLAAIDAGKPRFGRGSPVEVRLERWRVVRGMQHKQVRAAPVCLISDGDRVESTVIMQPRHARFRRLIREKCHRDARLFTTCYHTFRLQTVSGTRPETIEFIPDFYYDNPQVENLIHGFTNYTRRTIQQHFLRVDQRYLWLYLKEFEFRYNRRLRSQEIFWDMVGSFLLLGQDRFDELAAWNSR